MAALQNKLPFSNVHQTSVAASQDRLAMRSGDCDLSESSELISTAFLRLEIAAGLCDASE
jgi:hypothetical protein